MSHTYISVWLSSRCSRQVKLSKDTKSRHLTAPQATTPVAVLLTRWTLGLAPPSLKTLGNVSFIVIGVMVASYGEIDFVLVGFLFQLGGVIFEAIRLGMVERLLSSAEFKMDPLVSFYYFAPVCAIFNGIVALVVEVPRLQFADIERVGYITLLANALVAFGLNFCLVLLVSIFTTISLRPFKWTFITFSTDL